MIDFIVEVHLIFGSVLLVLVADAAALDSISIGVARRLSLLVVALRRRSGVGLAIAVLARLNVEQIDDPAVGRRRS